MRLHVLFAALVIALVGASAWVVWDDASPQWRRYQRQLVRREIVRIENELATARLDLERPEVRHELAELDMRLAALETEDTASVARLGHIRTRLTQLRDEMDGLRTRIRGEDRRLRSPELAEYHTALEGRLAALEHDYAAATGRWPFDAAALRTLWAARDSLADELLGIAGPLGSLRDSLDAKQREARRLQLEALDLGSVRDSLETLRSRLLEPVMVREAALARLREHTLQVREIATPDGREVARCPTCHGTLSEPPGVHPALPALETFVDVPCTVCHRGRGRALTVRDAHQGLLTASGGGAGRYSLRERIAQLSSRDPAVREQAREELRGITGVDVALDAGPELANADPESTAARAWSGWFEREAKFFEPGDRERQDADYDPLLAAGIDPWVFSARGRPLRYVGSRTCLRCHETRSREHVRNWRAFKARSLERLAGEPHPARCMRCHTTGYDPATGTYAEPGVSCEGCHGPGERYAEMMTVGQELLDRGDPRGTSLIEFSARLARDAASGRSVEGPNGKVNLCVSCHGPARHLDGGPGTVEWQARTSPGEAALRTAPGAEVGP